jgi:hypothetical protein
MAEKMVNEQLVSDCGGKRLWTDEIWLRGESVLVASRCRAGKRIERRSEETLWNGASKK